MDAMRTIWDGFDFSYLLSILLSVVPALLCITLHELSHGYVAYLLGDTTAKERGRLTLNPIKHLDPMGLLMMVLFRVGWAKPVPVNMYRFKNPKLGMAVTALAGPMCNVLIALVFLFLYGFAILPLQDSAVGEYLLEMIRITATISLGLAVFNMLPVPPLDGSKVLAASLNDEQYAKLMYYERYGSFLMLLLVGSGLLGRPLSMLINLCFQAISPLARWGLELALLVFYG